VERRGPRRQGRRRWLRGIALAVPLALGHGDADAADRFAVVDLGTLGGDASAAAGINASGQVVGWSATATGPTRAFLYAGGTMTALGTLSGGRDSQATAINDRGEVVGFAGINEFGPRFPEFTQGFIWQDGAMKTLGTLYCPCTFTQRYGTSVAYAINASGQVVGDSGTVRGESVRHAFVWQQGAMREVGGGAGSTSTSFAYAINAAGHVAGAFNGRAAVWEGETRRDLGALPGHVASAARGINAAGVVVGESGGAMDSRAALWRAGTIVDLGALPGDAASQASAINAAGDVVGWSGSADGAASRAVLWRGGAISDLNDLIPAGSGWTLTRAASINDAGHIVGAGIRNGRPRAFLLTPAGPVAPGPR